MSNYRWSSEEVETTIRISKTEELAAIWTNDPVYIRKLDTIVSGFSEAFVEREDLYGKQYRVPKNAVLFARKPREKQNLTDEQKAERLARLQHRKEG